MLRLHAAWTAVSPLEIGLHVRQAGFRPARHEDPVTRKEKLSSEVGNPPFVRRSAFSIDSNLFQAFHRSSSGEALSLLRRQDAHEAEEPGQGSHRSA